MPNVTEGVELLEDAEKLKSRFKTLRTRRDVEALLHISDKDLIYLLYRPAPRYQRFGIPKRRGGVRQIMAPLGSLKIVQMKLNQVLQTVYQAKVTVHGFVRNKSIVTNARVHARKRWVLNIDLLDFFPSINFGRVRGMFMAAPYSLPKAAATVLAQICCKEVLPQGAPTSPIVSNMICARFDSQMQRLVSRAGCLYTRYADDITISTMAKSLPAQLAECFRDANGKTKAVLSILLREAITSNGFQINEKKVRLSGPGTRKEVTGLAVNSSPNVRRSYVKQVRCMLHAWKRFGLEAAANEFRTKYDRKYRRPEAPPPDFHAVVLGKLEYIRMVKGDTDPVYQNLRYRLSLVDARYVATPIVSSRNRLVSALWVLESESEGIQGTAFMLKDHGLVTCTHVLTNDTVAYQLHQKDHKYDIAVVKKNDDIDLAILAIHARPEGVLLRGNGSSIKTGDSVTLAGFPNLGPADTERISDGQVDGTGRRFGVGIIFISAPIYAGHSGSPVMDSQLRVIGVAQRGTDSRGGEMRDTRESAVIAIEEIDRL